MPKPFQVVDASGDRKYFTIIPNIVINHSTHWERSLYLIMKKLAGEKGTCYASIYTLAEKVGVSRPTVSRTLKKLVKRGWIKLLGTRPGKTRPVREYTIVDIWKENVGNYERLENHRNNLSGRDRETTETKIGKGGLPKEEPYRRRYKKNTNGVFVDKVTKWAYTRAATPPSCSRDSFKRNVLKVTEKVGIAEVQRLFENETNAIRFLTNIRDL